MKKIILKSIALIIMVLGLCEYEKFDVNAMTLNECFKQYKYHGDYVGSVEDINKYINEASTRIDSLKLGKKYIKKLEKAKDILEDANPDKIFYLKYTNKPFKKPYYELTSAFDEYVYIGKIKDNKPNGEGVLFTPLGLGEICIGEFKNGQFNGNLIRIEHISAGAFEDNIFKKILIGEWKEGELNGTCVRISDELTIGTDGTGGFNKDIFTEIADYKKGKYHGNRKLYLSNNSLLLDVNMKDNEMTGKGKTYFPNGQLEYDGEFKNGKRHGKGKLYSESGDLVYSGKFKNGDFSS